MEFGPDSGERRMCCQRAVKRLSGGSEGPSLETNTLFPWPIGSPFFRYGGLVVCDGAHGLHVMKKVPPKRSLNGVPR